MLYFCDAVIPTSWEGRTAVQPVPLPVADSPVLLWNRTGRETQTLKMVISTPLDPHSSRGDHSGCTEPLPRERTARLQELFSLEMANI
jgi:hypothetical protein